MNGRAVAFSADQIGDERILNPRYAWHGMWFPPCRSTQTAWEQKHRGGRHTSAVEENVVATPPRNGDLRGCPVDDVADVLVCHLILREIVVAGTMHEAEFLSGYVLSSFFFSDQPIGARICPETILP